MKPVILRWKPLPICMDYEVSNDGRIRRVTGGRGAVPGRILKYTLYEDGHRWYSIQINGKAFCLTGARAVCLAFIGPPPTPKHEAVHNDGDPGNDKTYNVRWATHRENMQDAMRHGTFRLGAIGAKMRGPITPQFRQKMRNLALSRITPQFRRKMSDLALSRKRNADGTFCSRT